MARSRRNDAEEASEGAPEWLVTYSDLVTLLLTFFIMLFSMAVIDKQKFEQVATSLRSSFLHVSNGELFNYNSGEDVFSITEYNNSVDTSESAHNNESKDGAEGESDLQRAINNMKARKLEDVKKDIEEAIAKLELDEHVQVVEEKQILILRFDSVLLFDLGSADIKPEGREVLKKLGIMLDELENDIVIEGHTDNLPINTQLFPTNWELSTKRATNVVLFLVDNCGLNPVKLTAAGHGEFKPIRPNDSDENRQKNRRIDIVIEK